LKILMQYGWLNFLSVKVLNKLTLKGQSHEKFGKLRVWGVSLLAVTKNNL
jgi:hypothetical protein